MTMSELENFECPRCHLRRAELPDDLCRACDIELRQRVEDEEWFDDFGERMERDDKDDF